MPEFKTNKFKAFSLIELSIVILVIGILIAGVTKGSRMIVKSRINSARTLTQSSPVSSIKGLTLWFDATANDAFLSTEEEDKSIISHWQSLNPQRTHNHYALINSTPSTVIYHESSPINSLPSLYFDGNDVTTNYFKLSTSTSTADVTYLSTPDSAFTFFTVTKLDALTGGGIYKTIFLNGTMGGSGWGYIVRDTSARDLIFSGVTEKRVTGVTTKPDIVSATYDGISSGSYHFYANGTSISSGTVTAKAPSSGSFYIGDVNQIHGRIYNFEGFISEIIVYDRALKREERKSIESYLSQKYAIEISHEY